MNPSKQSRFVAWHTKNIKETIELLQTDVEQGLSAEEVQKRIEKYGKNEIRTSRAFSPFKLFLQQFQNSLLVVLILAALFSAFFGYEIEAIVIGVILFFSVLLGFFQEYRAERALDVLRTLVAPQATVLRAGEERLVAAAELVPGDLVVLSTGVRVAADMRLVQSWNIKMNETVLTGESLAVEKVETGVFSEETVIGDRFNMVFSGTDVVYGRGLGVVVETGTRTEFGKIAGLLQEIKRQRTPLQVKLDELGTVLSRFAFVLVLVVVLSGYVQGLPFFQMAILGIALAVAVVPEALPAVMTISLAIGVQRLIRRRALVRQLSAVETLGCTTVVCSDKTGTLTKNEMTVREIFLGDGTVVTVTGSGYVPHGEVYIGREKYQKRTDVEMLLCAAVGCSDASLQRTNGNDHLKGDPTEGALIVAAEKFGIQRLMVDAKFPRLAEVPFQSETKEMMTMHQAGQEKMVYLKGAPEVILGRCSSYRSAEGVKEMTLKDRERLRLQMELFASQAYRVIGVAYASVDSFERVADQAVFLGFFAMIDPPRPEVKSAIEACHQAGIRVVMITGDHPQTAVAIARELGLLRAEGKVVTGEELSQMDDETLEKMMPLIDICARVSPEHKLRLVHVLQRQGEVVAMTGDGINDAPAIKKADVGIAMGLTGTDVTREAAVMTLVDDNFASIVAAIEEGRLMLHNIKKYLLYLFSSNLGEIGLMMVSALCGLPLPLTAVQILYVNLATDGLPALALAVDHPEDDVMKQTPVSFRSGFFSSKFYLLVLIGGVWSVVVNVSLYFWSLRHLGASEAVTMVFVSLILIQFLKAYHFRSEQWILSHRPFSNTWLNRAIVWEIGLLLLVVYLPYLHRPFSTFALSGSDWFVVVGAALTISPVLEGTKRFLRSF